jgi:hypothetical protein
MPTIIRFASNGSFSSVTNKRTSSESRQPRTELLQKMTHAGEHVTGVAYTDDTLVIDFADNYFYFFLGKPVVSQAAQRINRAGAIEK